MNLTSLWSALTLLALPACRTSVTYFQAIEKGSSDGQYYVSIVRDTYSGGDLIARNSAIVEFQEDGRGVWSFQRVVVDGVHDELAEVLREVFGGGTRRSEWHSTPRPSTGAREGD